MGNSTPQTFTSKHLLTFASHAKVMSTDGNLPSLCSILPLLPNGTWAHKENTLQNPTNTPHTPASHDDQTLFSIINCPSLHPQSITMLELIVGTCWSDLSTFIQGFSPRPNCTFVKFMAWSLFGFPSGPLPVFISFSTQETAKTAGPTAPLAVSQDTTVQQQSKLPV